MDQKKPFPMTPFDMLVTTEELQMMKLILPYLPAGQQRTFAVFIKFTELRNTWDYFGKCAKVSSQSIPCSGKISPTDVLQEIRPYMKEEEAENLDMVFSAMSMMEMFQSMSENSDPAEILKSVMPPDKQEMFDIYKEMVSEGDEMHEPERRAMDEVGGTSPDEAPGSSQTGAVPDGI